MTSIRDRGPAHVPKVSPVTDVTPCQLTVRCLMEEVSPTQFQAFSLEFGLAVQAESEHEAKVKLERMIDHYLRDALLGEDREHAYDLLNRRATWSVYARYYAALAAIRCMGLFNGRAYHEPVPLAPCAA